MDIKIDKKDVSKKQNQEFIEALNDNDYKALVRKIKISKEDAKDNTIKLLDSVAEIKNCQNCKKLAQKEEKVKKTKDNVLTNARIKDIKITKNRSNLIKWIKEYYDNYNPYKTSKGLYLHGNFGTGKTFILASLLNELKNKYKINFEIVYVPELLRKLKEDFEEIGDKISYLENVDILLLDDIGAEKVSEWGRDEIIGTILQTRMNNEMPTFFTSNLNIDELEKTLSITKDNIDVIKAKRIIERIKYLTEDIELLGNNYREE